MRLCVEVFNGYRPAQHLRRIGGPAELDAVVVQLGQRNARSILAGQLRRGDRPHNSVAGRFAGQRPARHPSDQPSAGGYGSTTPSPAQAGVAAQVGTRFAPLSVQRIRVSEPHDGVAEVVAVLAGERRSFAVALRLERHGSRWLCALAQVV